MKNLHFYIQSAMLILALSFAVQIPFDSSTTGYVAMIEFILAIYQLGMSWLLMNKLSHKPLLLKVYVFTSISYILALILLAFIEPSWMNPDRWKIALLMFPWSIAILFLVVLNDLERARHYRI